MIIIRNSIIPLKRFEAIMLFGVIFVRKECTIDRVALNHEWIHARQMLELLVVGFYLIYLLEWACKLPFYGRKAYRNISLEKEAHKHERDMDYLSKRKHYAWLKG